VQVKQVLSAILLSSLILYGENTEKPRPDTSIKVALDVVLVPVTVTDNHNRPVEGLRAGDFQIWEDKIEQKVRYLSSEDTPVSVGLVFDMSASMRKTIDAARSAATTFLKTGNPEDEYFLVEFSDSPRVAQTFTTDVTRLQDDLAFHDAEGFTAVLDAVYLALENVRIGIHPRKALLMITDGEDNHSRYTIDDVKETLKESSVQLYALDMGRAPYSRTRNPGHALLRELAELTGGRVFSPNSTDELDEICAQISLELKSQYVLGYIPANMTADGKWRKLRVKVNPPAGISHVNVHTRAGYYASQSGITRATN
jgi:Ca-activated chloride channel family protein